MNKTAAHLIEQAKKWLGCNESDGTHKQIIDTYNSCKPLPRGYAMSYTDAWCAAFVSACAIAAGMTDIIPRECSCSKMIEAFKKTGCWNEDDSRIPNIGDIVFYDWEDSGEGDCTATPNHVGIVSSVGARTFEVIEGNKSDAVAIRRMSINSRYIRGFGVPKYERDGVSTIIYVVQKGDTLGKIARLYGLSVDEILSHNVGKIKNPDAINVGWEINIPIPFISEGSEIPETTPEDTRNYYAIGKLVVDCLADIKALNSYKSLIEALKSEGD